MNINVLLDYSVCMKHLIFFFNRVSFYSYLDLLMQNSNVDTYNKLFKSVISISLNLKA